jgi:hypothetical protein
MLWSTSSSKNKRLVKKWVNEHKKIVTLANKVIDSYYNNNLNTTKKTLLTLNKAALVHIMSEDAEYYRLLKGKNGVDKDLEKHINEFRLSFKDKKHDLRDFLLTYSNNGVALDSNFFERFEDIVKSLTNIITFEEEILYKVLASK